MIFKKFGVRLAHQKMHKCKKKTTREFKFKIGYTDKEKEDKKVE